MISKVVLTAPMRLMVPIIKVVGNFCNLRCTYCFYNTRDQQTYRVMSAELLERFLSQYMDLFEGRITFIWHGGEPLLAGRQFFAKAVDLQARYRRSCHSISNLIQTNATLVDDQWAQFFKEHKFRVGVSLDGSPESHDRFRKKYGGQGSFEEVKRGIETLRRHGLEPSFIQTLTRDTVSRVREDFTFFTNILKTRSWGVNSYMDIQKINERMIDQTIIAQELTEYLKRLIDLWMEEDNPTQRIREIDNFIAGVFGKQAGSCTFSGACTAYFCLEYDGRIYPCDRFSGRKELLFGNLSQEDIENILNGKRRLEYARRVNTLHADCVSCEWQKACHNGCTHHRTGGINGKYYYCETRKEIFHYLKEEIEKHKKTMD